MQQHYSTELESSSRVRFNLQNVLNAAWRSLKYSGITSSVFLLSAGFGAVTPANATTSTVVNVAAAPKAQLISQSPKKVTLTLISYAVTKEAYAKIIPQFAAKWKQERGQEVEFQESYAGSSTQARAVIDGLDADIVALALSLDVLKIQQAGLIDAGWEREAPNNGIVTRSVVAIVTRPGNPKKIRAWSDLAKPGISFITANPKTSGVARWNFLALWGSVTTTGGSEAKAQEFVTAAYKNVPILPKDAREATDIFFKQRQGDALLNYENEAILAAQKGEKDAFFVVPQANISIDNPVAVVDKNVDKKGTRQAAEAFVQFIYTPEAQREFAKVGFRPVNSVAAKETSKSFPKVTKLYTVEELGGWNTVQKQFFADGALFDRIQSTPR